MTNFEVVKSLRRAGSDQLNTTRHFSRMFGLHARQSASLSATQRLRKKSPLFPQVVQDKISQYVHAAVGGCSVTKCLCEMPNEF